MSSPQPQVSDEAVEAAVPRLEGLVCAPMTGERNAKDECRQLLADALPLLRADWERELRERLNSNEAHEAALDAQIRISGRASDRGTEAAINAALDAALTNREETPNG